MQFTATLKRHHLLDAMCRLVLSAAVGVAFLTTSALALTPEVDAVFVRVIDTGSGLACVVRMPGERYFVYDTGHWNGQARTFAAFQEILPAGETIDLMVLSHSDADHLGVTDELFGAYPVDIALRTGLERTTGTWGTANTAITGSDETTDLDLGTTVVLDGSTFRFGDVFVTKVIGRYWPENDDADWELQNLSERRNAGSIVVRLTFAGRSILFGGDAVGRHIGDPADALIATERFMIEQAAVIPIQSNVLIAPHHGADNGSSTAFIAAVDPDWVIFSAGHAHNHPQASTAGRYLAHGVALDHMFRTDLGDDTGPGEWNHGTTPGADPIGDDDVDILIRPNGELFVDYRRRNGGP